MKYDGVSFSIKVGEDTIEEYEVTVNKETKELACWIPSEVGAEFCIVGNNDLKEYGVLCWVKLDGRNTCIEWMDASESNCMIEGALVAENAVLPFVFSPILLTDDETARHRAIPDLHALGTIQVMIRRGKVVSKKPWTKPSNVDLSNLGPLHERTKKAGAHCVSLGKQRQVEKASMLSCKSVDTEDEPYCTFLFRYRPRDVLQAQGIIAAPQIPAHPNAQAGPSPKGATTSRKRPQNSQEPGQPEVKEESDDSDQDGESPGAMQARLDTMTADMEALRAQMFKAKSKRERKRVKRERSPIRLETSGAVIDLTLE
ncbi:hypothetical protein PHLGIDRAFT_30526 [Phlebiopsis gigantea 11061_1 CR5-6]|uniref:DUF7918 domain-containing protein n=1 Tax=Phlebiopsis gigantea (strain 11061_1 CR5-6) TaxID=745531 RepID=A0A0C3NMU9_PHLG1|nr:hypothetical protein PHLGIDRAFT_30526 [Phlebiopsis gigantea 11061_1 CR5-6]